MNTIFAHKRIRGVMHKLFAGVAAIFVFLTFLISSSFGQECRKDAKEWNHLSVGPVVTWAAPVCCTGDLMFQPFFFYDYIRDRKSVV